MTQIRIFFLTTSLAPIAAVPPPGPAVEACARTDSALAGARYIAIPARDFVKAQEDGSDSVGTTLRYGKEKIGTWERTGTGQSGLYNGKQRRWDEVTRLSGERPEPIDMYRAMWGIARSGARSYVCIAFNFDGLGQSGSFQSVRGVYLFERHARTFRPFYTVGRVTPGGVVLAR